MLNWDTDLVIGEDRGSGWSCAPGEPGVVGVVKIEAVFSEGVLKGDGPCFLLNKERKPIEGDCARELVEAMLVRRSADEAFELERPWFTEAARAFFRLRRTHLISAQANDMSAAVILREHRPKKGTHCSRLRGPSRRPCSTGSA